MITARKFNEPVALVPFRLPPVGGIRGLRKRKNGNC
jgi:hypothetical protein